MSELTLWIFSCLYTMQYEFKKGSSSQEKNCYVSCEINLHLAVSNQVCHQRAMPHLKFCIQKHVLSQCLEDFEGVSKFKKPEF